MAAINTFKDAVKRRRHHVPIAKLKTKIEIPRRLFQIIWTKVRIRLVRLLRSNTFLFYDIRQFHNASYPVAKHG